jgi:DNA-binding NarL/FixJ family response regulator
MVKRLIAQRLDTAAVVHECADGEQALAAYTREHPQWVVMDIELGQTNGLAATRAILEHDPQAKIIVVTQYAEPVYKKAAEQAGAYAFLLKDNLAQLTGILQRDTGSDPS